MFAIKIAKGLGLGSLGVLGFILMILVAALLWVVGGFIAALVPAWIAMLIIGAVGGHWGFMLTWVVVAAVMMVCGV